MFRGLSRHQVVIDLAVAGGYLLAAPALDRMLVGNTAALPVYAVAVVFAAALAVRRLSPTLALAVAWTAAIAQMALLLPPGFVDTAVFGVLYVTAAYGTRPAFWSGLASVPVGAAVATGYLFVLPAGTPPLTWSADRFLFVLALLLLALGLSWTVGALVRTARRAGRNRLAQARAEAEAAAEAQRVQIARDMHDVVAHSLAVVIAQADGARYVAAGDPAAATAALATIGSTARSALADVRLLLTQLRHRQGDGPQPGLADLDGLFAQVRAAGVDLRVDRTPAAVEPSAAVQLAAYRILQEALTNALRHGGGGPVLVALAWHADHVELTVRNGVAPSPIPPSPAGRGHGLIGMRERAQLVGGTLAAGVDGPEFGVYAWLPIAARP